MPDPGYNSDGLWSKSLRPGPEKGDPKKIGAAFERPARRVGCFFVAGVSIMAPPIGFKYFLGLLYKKN